MTLRIDADVLSAYRPTREGRLAWTPWSISARPSFLKNLQAPTAYLGEFRPADFLQGRHRTWCQQGRLNPAVGDDPWFPAFRSSQCYILTYLVGLILKLSEQ